MSQAPTSIPLDLDPAPASTVTGGLGPQPADILALLAALPGAPAAASKGASGHAAVFGATPSFSHFLPKPVAAAGNAGLPVRAAAGQPVLQVAPVEEPQAGAAAPAPTVAVPEAGPPSLDEKAPEEGGAGRQLAPGPSNPAGTKPAKKAAPVGAEVPILAQSPADWQAAAVTAAGQLDNPALVNQVPFREQPHEPAARGQAMASPSVPPGGNLPAVAPADHLPGVAPADHASLAEIQTRPQTGSAQVPLLPIPAGEPHAKPATPSPAFPLATSEDAGDPGTGGGEKFAAAAAQVLSEPGVGQKSFEKKSLTSANQVDPHYQARVGITSAPLASAMPTQNADRSSPAGPADLFRTVPSQVGVNGRMAGTQPEASPNVRAAQAVDAVVALVDAQAGRAQGSASAVRLNFNFNGDDLAVRVTVSNGVVHTQFRTDSQELRDAIATQWQASPSASGSSLSFLRPSFTGASAAGDSAPGTDGGASRRQESPETGEQGRGWTFARTVPGAEPGKQSGAADLEPAASAGHLHAFA